MGNVATIAAPTLANASITNPVFKWYLDANRTTQITNGMVDGAVTYTINPDQSLSISGLTATKDYYISVSGNNICENAPGNLKSVTVTVNTIEQPTIDLTGNQTIGTGGTLTLTAASSNANSYQWYKNGAPIAGAVNNSYTITNATNLNAGTYTVIALGLTCSSIPSAAVIINVGGFGSTKSVTGLIDGKINAGSQLTYTITITNTGNTDLNNISIDDIIPNGTSYVPNSADNNGTLTGNTLSWVIDIASKASKSVNFKVNVNNDLTGISTIKNTATVTDPNAPGGPTTQTPSTPDINTNQIRAFESSKTVSGLNSADKIDAGSTLIYTIRVENKGNVALTNITIADAIPNGTSYDQNDPDNTGILDGSVVKWTIANIPYQGFAEVKLKVKVTDNFTGIPSIGNTAIVTDPTDPDNPQTPTDPPKATDPKRTFTALKNIIGGLNNNDKISPDAELTFAITVKNTGSIDINNMTITDPIPAGTRYIDGSANKDGTLVNGILNWRFNLPFGATEIVTFKVKVAKDLTGISQIRNKATVTDPNDPENPKEPESPPTDTEPTRSFSSTKKIITGLNSNSRIDANSELTYEVKITNTGNIDLNDVTVSDPIPAGTTYIPETANLGGNLTGTTLNWTVNIPVGESINLIFKVKVAADLTNIPSIGNTATVTDPENPGNPQTPADPDKPTEQIAKYGLTSSITTANPSGKAGAGEELTVTITVENTGNVSLSNIVVTNPLPNHTIHKSTGTNGNYNAGTNTVTFTLSSIAVGSSATFTFKVDAAQNLAGVSSINNTANVKANGLDQNTLASIDVCATTSVATVTTNGTNTCSTSVQITATSTGVTNPVYYLYLGNALVSSNNSGIFDLTLPPGTNNTYTVGISGTGLCETLVGDRKSATVSVLPLLATPIVSLDSKTINSVTFRWNAVQDAVSYEYSINAGITWQPIGAATSYTFVGLKPAESVSISVRAIAANACQNSDASAVITESSDNPLGNEVFIPNTFTPNNDGNNDFFLVYGNTIKAINMRIYNQWGQTIFQSQQPTNGWDGTYRGQNQPTGVYIYSVELTFNDGTSTTKKGTITLIR